MAGADPLIVFHPRRPRLGLAVPGVVALAGDAELTGHLLDALLRLWAAVTTAVEGAPVISLARSRSGIPIREAQGALALRLGGHWTAAPAALRADTFFASLEARAAEPLSVLGFLEIDPWVHAGLIRAALQQAAGQAAFVAGEGVTPEAFVDAYCGLGGGGGDGGLLLGDALLPV